MVSQKRKFAKAAKKCAKIARVRGKFSRSKFNVCMRKELKSK